jgi:hypothetical protein
MTVLLVIGNALPILNSNIGASDDQLKLWAIHLCFAGANVWHWYLMRFFRAHF